MKLSRWLLAVVAILLTGALPASSRAAAPINILTFFGNCSDQVAGALDYTNATNECQVFQVWANIWNKAHADTPVQLTNVDWPGTTALNANLAAGTPPDLVILPAAYLSAYAQRGLLTPLKATFAKVGIDVNDITPAQLQYATFGSDVYALPLDNITVPLLHINLDIWDKAGLVKDGKPVIPTNEKEFRAAADAVLKATNMPFAAMQADGSNGTVWPWTSLVFQQGGTISDKDGKPTLNTPEGIKALNFLVDMQKQGYFTSKLNYADAESLFLNGKAASLLNGTWAVGSYDQQAKSGKAGLKNYTVVPFPSVFGPQHEVSATNVVAIPLGANPDAARLTLASQFLKLVYDNLGNWALTGHLPVRKSALSSADFLKLPHRSDYVGAANGSMGYPAVNWISGYETVLNEEIQGAYIGTKTSDQALKDAQSRLLDLSRFAQ